MMQNHNNRKLMVGVICDPGTSSQYLIQINQLNILVDYGLFQGYKELRLRNWAELPINPKNIDYSGYIPLLVKNGFCGKILCIVARH